MLKMKNRAITILSVLTALLLIVPGFKTAASADETGTVIEFADSSVTVSGDAAGVKVSGTDVKINSSGTYTLTGSCSSGSVVVKKSVTGVTIVLDGLNLTSSATAPITCNKGSGVTIIAKEGTVSTLADDKYNNDDIYTDETVYPDIENAVIKCKDGSNVTVCGTGTININAYGKNGIKGGYDLYEEDENGNATSTLLSTASLTVKEVTLNISATVNDAIKSDKELNILSGNITVSAADDGIKSDYVLNIGAPGTAGPTVNITGSNEGIEAATLNVYSGNVTVNASDDGINAANSDLSGYSFSYNQYGGYVYVNCSNGDGIDSNGTINLSGGTLEVYSPSQGDGDPLDADGEITFGGATVLAVGHNAMRQRYTASTPYVTFGSTGTGGFGGFGGPGRNTASQGSAADAFGGGSTLVKAGSVIAIKDSSGSTLYSATAVRDADFVLFASESLTNGSSYKLYSNGSSVATASAGASSSGTAQPGVPEGEQGEESVSPVFAFFRGVINWFMRVIQIIKSFFSGLTAA